MKQAAKRVGGGIEVLIVDDGSTDDTVKIIENYKKQYNINGNIWTTFAFSFFVRLPFLELRHSTFLDRHSLHVSILIRQEVFLESH